MNTKAKTVQALLAALAMGVLVLDGKTAVEAALEGSRLCLTVVIPSLFPFFFLSSMVTEGCGGVRLLSPLLCRCGIPRGAEPIFLAGLLGGFPVGAQSVCEACGSNRISREQALGLLGICNQAGPAFLFGVVAPLFSSTLCGAVLWGIQTVAALLTGLIFLGKAGTASECQKGKALTASQRLSRCVRSMAYVCAWVILFRVVIAFAHRWLFFLLPLPVQILLTGLLELTNGCLRLRLCESEAVRFLLAGTMLSCGGFCVTMQTASLSANAGLSMGLYVQEKLTQSLLTAGLCALAAPLLFAGGFDPVRWLLLGSVSGLITAVIFIIRKIKVAKQGNFMYNKE